MPGRGYMSMAKQEEKPQYIKETVEKTDAREDLKLFFQNIQSVRNKINELEVIIKERLLNVILLSEHWLAKEEEGLYVPEGFQMITGHFRTTLTKGGTAIMVRSDIKCKIIPTEEFAIDEHFEISAIQIKDFKMIVVYRSPKGDIEIFLNRLDKFMQNIIKAKGKIIIGGDWNVDFIKGEANAIKIENTLKAFGLVKMIEEPTRGKSCLDNVFTNIESNECSSKVEEQMSDHKGITVMINEEIVLSKRPILSYRPLTEKGKEKFKSYLKGADWTFIDSCEISTNEKYTKFVDCIHQLYLHCFPLRRKRRSKKVNCPWYGEEEKRMREEMTKLYDLAKNNRNSREWIQYKSKSKMFKKHLKQKKIINNEKQINEAKNKTKKAWDLVKEITGDSRKKEDQVNISADTFNDFFIQVQQNKTGNKNEATKMLKQAYSTNLEGRPELILKPVSKEEIRKTAQQLSNSNSKDAYGMSNKFLKEIIDVILAPLTDLINKSIAEGLFPDVFKLSKVVPIFKKGDKNNPNSYRPVSIVPTLGKVLEQIVKKQLLKHLELNGYLAESQYGYRENKSTVLAVMKIVDKALEGFEKKKYVHITACDLSKAFDNLSRELCLTKLVYLGIKGNSLKFFKCYLTGTEQYVEFDNSKSKKRKTEDGTPQGSVMGGYAFLMGINDLEPYMKNTAPINFEEDIVTFVDDTNMIHSHQELKELKQKAEERLQHISKWFEVNNFRLNKEKTQTLTFSLRKNDDEDKPVNVLGIVLDRKMTWQPHKEKISSKISKYIYVLRKLKTELPKKTLISVYNAMVQSTLSYGIILYGHTNLQDLLVLQKKALRIIVGAKRRDSCREIFKAERVMTVINLYIYNSLLYMKLKSEDFCANSDFHMYNTRGKDKLAVPQSRLEKMQVGHKSLGVKMFNKLSKQIVDLPFLQFKRYIKKLLHENVFYSVKDFLNSKI